MKRFIWLLLGAMLFVGMGDLFAGKPEKMLEEALATTDPAARLQKLEEFYSRYAEKPRYQTMSLFEALLDTSLQVSNKDAFLKYAEASLACPVLTDADKARIRLRMAKFYLLTGEPQKASDMADEVLAFGKTFNNPLFDRIDGQEAKKIKLQVMANTANTEDATRKGLESSVATYEKNPAQATAVKAVLYFAKKLYDDYGKCNEAIGTLEKLADNESTRNLQIADQLGEWHYQDGTMSRAQTYVEMAYQMERNARRAYLLGRIFQASDRQKAMDFLAEGVVLGGNDAERCSGVLKDLIGKVMAEELSVQTPEGQPVPAVDPVQVDARHAALVDQAKARLGQS